MRHRNTCHKACASRKSCRLKTYRKTYRNSYRKSYRNTYRKTIRRNTCRTRRIQHGGELSVNLNGDHAPQDGKRYQVSQVELYDNRSPKLVYHGEAVARVPIIPQICRENALQCAHLPVTYEMDGHGILIEYEPDSTFTRYEGEFANNMKQGNGRIAMSNGTTYDGNWENDTMSGRGKISFTNSFYKEYDGDFANGTMHGKGIMEMINGDTYEGDFVDGNMHGTGKLVFKNGDTYEGTFINGNMVEEEEEEEEEEEN